MRFQPPLPSYRTVARALGAVLITAALLKVLQHAGGRAAPAGVLGSRGLAVLIIELELLLGAWLLSGVGARWARRVALSAFAGFAAVSFSQALDGAASCGCFGDVALSPWYVAALDLVAVMALWLNAPVESPAASGWRSAGFAGAAVSAAVAAGVVMMAAGSPVLEPSSAELDLGIVRQGGAASAELWLTNRGSNTVSVAAVRTSCPCLSLVLDEPTVAGSKQVRAEVRLDLRGELDFIGRLRIEVLGETPDGTPAFALVVRATVRPKVPKEGER